MWRSSAQNPTHIDRRQPGIPEGFFRTLLDEHVRFIKGAYLPDLLMAGLAYASEAAAGIGSGLKSYLSYGFFEQDDTPLYGAKTLFPSGVVLNGDLSKVITFDQRKVAEDVTTSRGMQSCIRTRVTD
jgi:quinone-reactive Ni/Fe-hydrogenase large subunit